MEINMQSAIGFGLQPSFVLIADRSWTDAVPLPALELERLQKMRVRRTLIRKIRLGFALLLMATVPLLWITGIAPSGSRVEIHPPPGEAVSIGCHFGFSFAVPTKQGGMLALPVGYGKAFFQVTFSDGQVAWAEFFNSDVGARRKIDIYVSRATKGHQIQFREVINGEREIFRGSVEPARTSRDKPFLMDRF